MTVMQGKHLRRAAVAVAVLATIAVSGCAQKSPGVAAYVGDQQISDRQLNEAVDGVNAAIGQESPVPRQDVITAMVLGEVSAQIAARKNIVITEAQRAAETNPTLLNIPAAKAVAFDLADSLIVQQKLGSEAFLAEVKATPVEVNPRYGVWNPDTTDGSILNGEAGSLSQPAAVQTP
ncbi:MAG: hypothetical protein QOF52_1172 [Propionibacteriaceae bacterium]|jgi:hypothetical protein|nr:hypothetical protein [Propionibacteriaceae bacterium]MDX6321314.1 hypothetical protein [Propionibacteriaceae bacterium]